MRVDFRVSGEPDQALLDDISESVSTVWALAAGDFYARHVAAVAREIKPPLGIQPFINDRLDYELPSSGWEGSEGRFTKDNAWLRITFRHAMSLGSDFMDGLLLAYREGIRVAVIAAPSREFARLVTPRDAGAIITYERLEEYFSRAHPLFQIPLVIARLSEGEGLPPQVTEYLAKHR